MRISVADSLFQRPRIARSFFSHYFFQSLIRTVLPFKDTWSFCRSFQRSFLTIAIGIVIAYDCPLDTLVSERTFSSPAFLRPAIYLQYTTCITSGSNAGIHIVQTYRINQKSAVSNMVDEKIFTSDARPSASKPLCNEYASHMMLFTPIIEKVTTDIPSVFPVERVTHTCGISANADKIAAMIANLSMKW